MSTSSSEAGGALHPPPPPEGYRRVRLLVEYDGTDFSGWQLQPRERTVQGVLEDAIGRLLGTDERVIVRAAGRTDAGVHAEGQVASVDVPVHIPNKALAEGLTGDLPLDVAVLAAEDAPPTFEPRFDARGKRYRYRIYNAYDRRPLLHRRSWWIRRTLDVPAMAAAAEQLLGQHDFTSFRGARCASKTPIKRLDTLDVTREVGGFIEVVAEGPAFLRHMVRNLVGTLVQVGHGQRTPEDMRPLLELRDRAKAGPTAPPQGLTLEAVYY